MTDEKTNTRRRLLHHARLITLWSSAAIGLAWALVARELRQMPSGPPVQGLRTARSAPSSPVERLTGAGPSDRVAQGSGEVA